MQQLNWDQPGILRRAYHLMLLDKNRAFPSELDESLTLWSGTLVEAFDFYVLAYAEAKNIPAARFLNWLNEKNCVPYAASVDPLVAHPEQVADDEADPAYEILDLINPEPSSRDSRQTDDFESLDEEDADNDAADGDIDFDAVEDDAPEVKDDDEDDL